MKVNEPEMKDNQLDQSPSCWHCGVVLACAPILRCEDCPEECDMEGCDEPGCATAAPSAPQVEGQYPEVEAIRERVDRLQLTQAGLQELASTDTERAYEHTINDLCKDIRELLAERETLAKWKRHALRHSKTIDEVLDHSAAEHTRLTERVRDLEAENERLRSGIEKAAKKVESYCDRPEDMDTGSVLHAGINVLLAQRRELRDAAAADLAAAVEAQRRQAMQDVIATIQETEVPVFKLPLQESGWQAAITHCIDLVIELRDNAAIRQGSPSPVNTLVEQEEKL